jgi:hypothetical protein
VEQGARADLRSVDVVLGVTAVVGSLFGYFFYIIVAFSAITALLIELSNESTVQDVLHYPRPIFDQAAITPDSGAWEAPDAPKKEGAPTMDRKDEAPARDTPAKDNRDIGATAVAKLDASKRNPETKRNTGKVAHLQRANAPARRRDRQNRGYAVAYGNAQGWGYRPGLDAQR